MHLIWYYHTAYLIIRLCELSQLRLEQHYTLLKVSVKYRLHLNEMVLYLVCQGEKTSPAVPHRVDTLRLLDKDRHSKLWKHDVAFLEK